MAVQAVAGVAKVKGVRDSVVHGRSVPAPCPEQYRRQAVPAAALPRFAASYITQRK